MRFEAQRDWDAGSRVQGSGSTANMRFSIPEDVTAGMVEEIKRNTVSRQRHPLPSNIAHIRHSRPDFGLGFQVKVENLQLIPSWLASGRENASHREHPERVASTRESSVFVRV